MTNYEDAKNIKMINNILNNEVQSAGESTIIHLWGATILKSDMDQMLLKSDVT